MDPRLLLAVARLLCWYTRGFSSPSHVFAMDVYICVCVCVFTHKKITEIKNQHIRTKFAPPPSLSRARIACTSALSSSGRRLSSIDRPSIALPDSIGQGNVRPQPPLARAQQLRGEPQGLSQAGEQTCFFRRFVRVFVSRTYLLWRSMQMWE